LFQKKISKFIIIQKIIEHFIVNLRTKETKIGEYYSIYFKCKFYLFIYFFSFILNSLFLTDQTKTISTFILKVYSYEIISIFFKKRYSLYYIILFYFILIRIFEPILNEIT